MDRKKLIALQPYELHKELLDKYLEYCKSIDLKKREKRDIDVIQENHKFVWDEDDEVFTWEQKLARKYYDKLFKEYCICDLSLYKKSQVAMRWQTEGELVSGKGQFICGNKICDETTHLRTWEVNFSYMEHYQKKNTLVKLRLCMDCSNKLNYKHKKKEIKRQASKPKKDKSRHSNKEREKSDNQPTTSVQSEAPVTSKLAIEDNVWSEQLQIEDEKPREDDFEDYLEQLLF
ncbi:protein FRA10AC1 [Rhopalosiphum padi]|uniref:protein FRA10AC1 n=1 Tax=Rhopalosiphum padi TaxID=40932 RepID=UPI00298E989D|nr:protein FRA10AC1 [Rhopalosiphum padi]